MAEKLLIIGSGPAAWTCAIYAARANLNPLVYEGAITEENHQRGTLPLGQLNLTTEVENFPGFPEGILGPELMVRTREQATRFGTRVQTDDIVSVDLKRRPFTATDASGNTIEAQSIVIATGASANYLGLESEHRYKNFGVSACAVCDGALPRFRNQPLIVVGGGDSAAEEGTYLSKFASAIHLVHRRDTLNRASPIMAERLLANAKVRPLWNSAVEEVLGEEVTNAATGERLLNMTGVRIKNLKTGDTHTLPAAGMFLAIGHTPNTKFLNGQLEVDDKGFVVLKDPFRTTTSVDGVFAAGDVADPVYKQAITAAGMGCKAALDAERWLAAQGVH
ncbi:MAG TPA: thioredoxin-disulfide reductase [Tepidisphaeraceae bacterium]|jgi:thioredoxin reductase (NADPH)